MDTTKRMPAKKMKKTTTEEENSVQGARRDWKSVCQYGMRFVTHIFLLPFLASREKGSVGWGGGIGLWHHEMGKYELRIANGEAVVRFVSRFFH